MRKKKRIHSLLAILVILGMCVGLIDCHATAESSFDYSSIINYSEDGTATFKDDYATTLTNAGISEIVLPDTYNNINITKYTLPSKKAQASNCITSLTMNKAYSQTGVGEFAQFTGLKKLIIPYDGTEFKFMGLLSQTSVPSVLGGSTSIEEIYLNASSVSFAINQGHNVFKGLASKENFKIYVTSEDVKKQIVEGTKKANSDGELVEDTDSVPESKVIVQKDESKKEVTITLKCENITVGKTDGFSPTYEIKDSEGNVITVPEEKIKISLYKDAEGLNINSSYFYNSSNLPIGDYYIGVTMDPFDDYLYAKSVIKVSVEANKPTDKTALNAAIDAANTFYEENQYNQANYDQTAWNNVFYRGNALDKAKDISADTENRYSQTQVDEATTNLTNALDALKKSVANNDEAWNKLQEAITKAEAVIPNKDKYTDESWALYNLPGRIEEAKALKKDDATTTVREIERHITLLQSAIDSLELKPVEPEVKPGTPFAYIKKGSQVKVLSMTAPEKLAGATKIRVTFQCAEDVSFNENASIDINPIIAGEDNYLQIKGTGGYETGKTYTVEVPLSAAIKAGDSIEIIMTTFSWDDAKDYVYGITAIEFVDADDKALGSYVDTDVFKENLATAIKEAEAINTSTYTDDSVKKLTDALAAAKALKEDATAEEMKQVIDAINDAIKGLQKKDEDEEARAKLTAKLKEAEAIDTSLYTAESVEKLTKALEAAKALKEDASAEEINQVLTAIDEAIKGLVKKDGGTQPPTSSEQVIGVAKGKTFTAGSFNYKVSTAATITGTVKKAGKVTLVGLSKASKNKSSINVKNTISASGASYQVTAIGSKAFAKATKLKKVTLGSNIKSIPTGAFMSCKKLTTVKATGVTKIGKNAFKGCKVLKKLTFGKKKVSSVKKGAFKGCKKTIKVAGGSKKVRKGNVKKLKKSGYKKFK